VICRFGEGNDSSSFVTDGKLFALTKKKIYEILKHDCPIQLGNNIFARDTASAG
jgi:hypothetical protein